MFDDPRVQANGHLPQSQGAELFSAELEPVHELLLATSEAWRADLPASDRLAAFARSLPSADTPAAKPIKDNDISDLSPEVPPTLPPRMPQRPHPLPAIVAAVAIVTLLAGALAHFAQGRLPNTPQQPTSIASGQPTATKTVRPGYVPITGQWSVSSMLVGSLIVVSMSDPNVLYRDGTRLQRSDNGGKIWYTIATPQVPDVGDSNSGGIVEVLVSTGNPNEIVAKVQTPFANASVHCPRNAQVSATPLDGGILAGGVPYCTEAFASRDAGAHWQPVRVPTGNSPDLSGAPFFGRYLLAQGDLLYGSIIEYGATGQQIGVRIVVSDDGVNWRYADDALRAKMPYICDYRPVPASTILYAVTLTQPCSNGWNGPHQIWRSNDGGAHWSPVDSVIGVNVVILGESPQPATGVPVLYVGYSDSTVKDSFRVHVVREALQSLLIAPTAGIPSGQEPIFRVFGTLGDGSIVEAYADRNAVPQTNQPVTLTFYAWRMGDSAWRRIAPSISIVASYDTIIVATPANHLWLIASSYQGNQDTRNIYSYAA